MKTSKLLILTTLLALACTLTAHAAADSTAVNLMPQLSGMARVRFTQSTTTGQGHFQVPNARLSLKGNITPWAGYFFNLGLCEYGKVKILDVYAHIAPAANLTLTAGQFRIPFGTEPFRLPAQYIFTNRSFIGKYIANVRSVGAKATYSIPSTPLKAEAGMFNPMEMADHTSYTKTWAWSTRLMIPQRNGWFGQTGFMSILPGNVRLNLASVSAGYQQPGLTVEAEYMRQQYAHGAFHGVNAMNLYGQWRRNITAGIFNRLSLQGRFDAATAHSSGLPDANGKLIANQPSQQRATLGATLSHIAGKRQCHLRCDYEKYFFGHGGRPGGNQADRLCLELAISF